MMIEIIGWTFALISLLGALLGSIWLLGRWGAWLDAALIPNVPPRWVRSGDRKLRVTIGDHQAALALQQLALLWEAARMGDPPSGRAVLLAARPVLRGIERADAAAGLAWCLQFRFPELNRLAIWLLGRSRGTLGAASVVAYRRHPDVHIRREVARTLVRMRAWNDLRRMAAIDSDPQVRRLAAPREKQSFASRFAALAASGITAARPSAEPGPTPLVWNVPPDAGRPPKAASWIRHILERIHHLLRGEAQTH